MVEIYIYALLSSTCAFVFTIIKMIGLIVLSKRNSLTFTVGFFILSSDVPVISATLIEKLCYSWFLASV